MSSAARLILTNSSLSSLPLFTMGMFLLVDGVHAKLDTLRSRFFWEGTGIKRKYHLVKWAAVCRPKIFGGLGVTNSKLMNVALLTKWWWRLAQNESGLWADILRAKYFPDGNLFKDKTKGSPFWNGIQAVRPAFSVGAHFTINNGMATRFWLDRWWGQSPLWQSHPDLYQLATDTNIFVGDVLRVHPPAISFMRPLNPVEAASWAALVHDLRGRTLCQGADEVSWSLSSSHKFMVKSLYNKLTEGTALDMARGLWKADLPLKIKIFMWQMFCDRLPTPDNVSKRNRPTDGSCAVCGSGENANHVFFGCALARFSWSAVRDTFKQNWNPLSSDDLLDLLTAQKGAYARIVWKCVGALLWSLWTVRNKITIEQKFPAHPADIIFKCHIFLQTWAMLGKTHDVDRMEGIMEQIKATMVKARQTMRRRDFCDDLAATFVMLLEHVWLQNCSYLA